MKITKLSAIIALTLGGLLLCSTAAMAQDNKDSKDGKDGKGRKGGFGTVEQRLERMTTELKLTDEQKPKVKAVLEEQDKKMQGFRDLPQDERREKFRTNREEAGKKLKEILTADQYKQYEEMMARRGPGGKKGAGKEADTKKEGSEKKN